MMDGGAVRPLDRLATAAAALLYAIASVPVVALATVLLLAGAGIGLLLAPFWIGLPILTGVADVVWRYAHVERRLANRLLRARIPPLPRRRRPARRGWPRLRATLRAPGYARAVALLVFRIPIAALAAVAALGALALAAVLVVLGLESLAGVGDDRFLGPVPLGPPAGVVLLLLALPAGVVATAVLDGLAAALRRFMRSFLLSPAPAEGPVREMLAESLGDRSLNIVYWLPEREIFVDEHGTPVEMPAPGSGRAWTSVDRDGRRVAAIVHDADLDASRELVQAAATGAALALDNEQLKADLRARLEELRASRIRIVEAGDAARRRLERDLHDGAQQQLVALALELRLLKRRTSEDPEAAVLIERASQKLAVALEELRELARGIHPAILTDRGLGPAVQALTRRFPMDVDCHIAIDSRVPEAVEAAAYFVVTEALTNVAKYAHASHVRVRLAARDGAVEVEVSDDGIGGADPRRGSGLAGLGDRLAAVEGELQIESPPGEGTRIRGRIPVPAPAPGAASPSEPGSAFAPAVGGGG